MYFLSPCQLCHSNGAHAVATLVPRGLASVGERPRGGARSQSAAAGECKLSSLSTLSLCLCLSLYSLGCFVTKLKRNPKRKHFLAKSVPDRQIIVNNFCLSFYFVYFVWLWCLKQIHTHLFKNKNKNKMIILNVKKRKKMLNA